MHRYVIAVVNKAIPVLSRCLLPPKVFIFHNPRYGVVINQLRMTITVDLSNFIAELDGAVDSTVVNFDP